MIEKGRVEACEDGFASAETRRTISYGKLRTQAIGATEDLAVRH